MASDSLYKLFEANEYPIILLAQVSPSVTLKNTHPSWIELLEEYREKKKWTSFHTASIN